MKYYLRFFISFGIILICTNSSASEVALTLPLGDDWRQVRCFILNKEDNHVFRNGRSSIYIALQFQEFNLNSLQSEIKDLQMGGVRILTPDPTLLFGMDNLQFKGVDRLGLRRDMMFGAVFWGNGLKVDIVLSYSQLQYPEDNMLNEKLFNALLSSVAGQIAGLDKLEVLPIFVLHGVASSLSKCSPL